MTALVIAEHDNASIKGVTLNTVTAAGKCGGDVHVLIAGHNAAEAAKAASQIAGVAKVLHADAEYFAHGLAENVAAQVLAIARTLVYESGVLLMDEPFGNIDAQTRIDLQRELLELWEQTRPTVIFITHDLTEAIALSDEIIVLSKRPAHCIARIEVGIPRPRDPSRIQLASRFKDCASACNSAVTP